MPVQDVRGVLLYGPPGCGKSYIARIALQQELGDIIGVKSSNSKWYTMPAAKKPIIVFEDVDKNTFKNIPINDFKFILDRYPYDAEIKGD